MKLRLIAVAVAAFAFSAGNAVAQDTSTEKGKLSYAFGYDYGTQLAGLAARGEQIDVKAVTKGLEEAFSKKQPSVATDQLRPVFEAFQKREQQRAQQAKAEWEKVAAANKTKSDAFVSGNKSKPGIKSLPSGVQYRVIEEGKGAKPVLTNTVNLEVAGPFPMGERPKEARPPQNMQAVKLSEIQMPAMREVLQQMPGGSKWEVTLPADKAYGADPSTGFPPNVAVQFEIKLISVK